MGCLFFILWRIYFLVNSNIWPPRFNSNPFFSEFIRDEFEKAGLKELGEITDETSTKIHYCDINNKKLLSVLRSIIKPADFNHIYSIHWIQYESGYECLEHTDMSSYTTYILNLNNNFEGGELFVNGENTNSKCGDVVIFNGMKDKHRVSKITKGIREVLVIWISTTSRTKDLIWIYFILI